ncbi:MAG: hypothetical protein VYB44_07105 [Bacteroidota bacterium]|nr:hypothetical protein [Bacteroidota bacterium]
MSKVKANLESEMAEPKEEKKSIFQMASESSEPDNEDQEDQEDQEDHQEEGEQGSIESEEQEEFDSEELISRLEKDEELTKEELDFLKKEGLIEMEEVEEFIAPPDLEDLQSFFPGRNLSSQESVEQARKELYEKYNEAINNSNQLSQQVQEITNTLNESEELRDILKSLKNGRSLRSAIIEAGFSASDFEVSEGDEDEEDMIEAKVNARERQRQRQKQEEEQKANMAQTNQVIESLEYSPEDKEKVLNLVNETFQDMIRGKVTKQTIEMFYRALNHDSQVKKEVEKAERRIRNQKITILKQKKKGDGQPRIVSRQNRTTTPQKDTFFSALTQNVIQRSTRFSDRAKGKG